MRKLHNNDRKKKGCAYCADALPHETDGKERHSLRCTYNKCPYRELDGFASYDQFIKATNNSGVYRALVAGLIYPGIARKKKF